ncbi:YgfZ/GcvT domain-containing protein [Humidisolicoccus flavus]|uniref:CAF17-like 4Fe-4S cluster assembly/insertion protein YgfZ n=1 Tax=Humidisolicoccus flavus TaxID=3111414 RepID=UPI003251C399
MSMFSGVPGAVTSEAGDVQHYGNPFSEQRDLTEGGIVALLNNEVLVLTGPDRLTWLDSITSQALARLQPGESAESLVLSPNGRVEHSFRIVDDGATAYLLLGPGESESLEAWLLRMRFMRQVEIENASDRLATIAWVPNDSLQELPHATATWVDPWPETTPGGYRYGAVIGEWSMRQSLVPRSLLEAGDPRTLFGVSTVAGTIALEALRVAAARPSMQEVDETTIPHELDWLATAVHLSKGCYRGQETVAKVHNLGAPPRRLTFLHLDGSENVLPKPGDAIELETVHVGTVTASAQHYELGPIALGVLKRSVDPSASLVVRTHDGEQEVLVAAGQETIVPPTAGGTARPPRLPRLGAVRRPRPASAPEAPSAAPSSPE